MLTLLPVPSCAIFGWGAAEPVPVQVPEEEAKPKHKRQRERREEKREAQRLGRFVTVWFWGFHTMNMYATCS